MRRCLILAQAPGATSPHLPLMPRGRQLGPGPAAAGICVPREQQWEAGLTQEAMKPRFKQISQKPPPLETQQYLLAPLPQLLLAEVSANAPQLPTRTAWKGRSLGPGGDPRLGAQKDHMSKGSS